MSKKTNTYWCNEDNPEHDFLLQSGFTKQDQCPADIDRYSRKYRYGFIYVCVQKATDKYAVWLMSGDTDDCMQVFPKDSDGFVDCVDIHDLLLICGLNPMVELH